MPAEFHLKDGKPYCRVWNHGEPNVVSDREATNEHRRLYPAAWGVFMAENPDFAALFTAAEKQAAADAASNARGLAKKNAANAERWRDERARKHAGRPSAEAEAKQAAQKVPTPPAPEPEPERPLVPRMPEPEPESEPVAEEEELV